MYFDVFVKRVTRALKRKNTFEPNGSRILQLIPILKKHEFHRVSSHLIKETNSNLRRILRVLVQKGF